MLVFLQSLPYVELAKNNISIFLHENNVHWK